MKRCSRCEREIAEWATSCIECDDLELGAVPPVEAAVPPAASIVAAASIAGPAMAPPARVSPPSAPVTIPAVPHVTHAAAPSAPAVAAPAQVPAVRMPPVSESRTSVSLPSSVPAVVAAPAAPIARPAVSAAPAIAAPQFPHLDQSADEDDYAAAVAASDDFEASLDALDPSASEFEFTPAPEFAAVQGFVEQVSAPVMPPPAPKAVPSGNSRRRMALAALLVVVGGSLTFAMLRTSAPAVPVAAPAAARKPAAPKPAPKPAATTAATATAPAAAATTTVPAASPAAPAARPATVPAPAAPVAVAPPVPAVASKWNANNKDWLVNSRKGVAFELRSLKKVGIWQGIAQPVLVVRCDAGRIQTFVYTASAIQMEAVDEDHTVRVSFDGEPEATERWADSPEHDALFAPDAAAFARRLTTAQTLRVSYTPHNAPRAVAEFQTHGLSDLIVPAAKQCGWKK